MKSNDFDKILKIKLSKDINVLDNNLVNEIDNMRKQLVGNDNKTFVDMTGIIIDNINTKSSNSKISYDLPQDIYKFEVKLFGKRIKKDYIYHDVFEISPDIISKNEICCSCMNKDYSRCKKKVICFHSDLNIKDEAFDYKYNVPLCSKHLNEIKTSKNKTTSQHGFIFESDLYELELYEF
jgi:hypothetical protein